MILARLALRELLRSSGKLVLPVLCLAVAVAAHSSTKSLSARILDSMNREARAMAGGDLEIGSPRPLSSESRALALAALPPGTETATVKEFLSMARDPKTDRTRMVEVRAVSGGFPFYGGVETAPADSLPLLEQDVVALAQPEITPQLGVTTGGEIRLGQATFKIGALVIHEPGPAPGAFALGPRIWISERALARTKLEQTGSRIRYRTVFKIEKVATDEQIENWKNMIDTILADPGLRVRTYKEANPQLRGFYERLTDFLSLMSLFVFLLAGIGVASSLQSHLRSRLATVAILRCVGASSRQILGIFLSQAVCIGALGSAIGVAAGALLSRALPSLLGQLVDFPSVSGAVASSGMVYIFSFGLGLAITLLFSAVSLVELPDVRPLRLLRPEDGIATPGWKKIVAGAASVLLLMAVGTVETGSIAYGGGTVAGIVAFGALVFGVIFALLTASSRFRLLQLPFALRYGTKNLFRSRAQSSLTIAVLSLGILLLASVQVLRGGMLGELTGAQASLRPQLFLIDIGDEQRAGVEKLLHGISRPARFNWNKLIRARMKSVNGEAVKREPDGNRDDAPANRSREYNLSERESLYAEAESVVGGKFWSAPLAPGGVPEVSVADTFADRAGIKLNDRILFEIQGVEITARVTSLRRVRWSTFQPNFMVLFRPGSLEGAPFQWITSVGGVSPAEKSRAQSELVRDYPTVTAIDIDEVTGRLLDVAGRLEAVVKFLSAFTLAAGLLILAMMAIENARARSPEIALLKVLGGTRSDLAAAVGWEFTLLGAVAAFAGALGALALGYGILRNRFGVEPNLLTPEALGLLALLVLGSAFTGLIASLRVFRVKPLETLRS